MACPTRLSRTILSACDAVLTALRPHARLGASSSPHVAALRALRRRCRGSADGGAAPTSLEICVPFIGLVRTAESSGPYTGAALSALSRYPPHHNHNHSHPAHPSHPPPASSKQAP